MTWLGQVLARRPRKAAPRVLFVHFTKTGGTTVHDVVSASLPNEVVCPIRAEPAGDPRDAEVLTRDFAPYRFVSGHFSLARAFALQERYGFELVTLLRDPVARIVSQYNFTKTHSLERHPDCADPESPFRKQVAAIKTLPPEEFFRSALCCTFASFNNTYVRSLSMPGHGDVPKPDEAPMADLAEVAVRALDRFSHVGLTEHLLDTVNFIRSRFGERPIDSVPRRKATSDEMVWHEWMEPAPLMTAAELAPFVGPLVAGDGIVYQAAVARHGG